MTDQQNDDDEPWLVRCHDAFVEYSKTREMRDGDFYIVYRGKVLEEPLPSRWAAHQLLMYLEAHEGINIKCWQVLIVNGGDPWGEKNPTRTGLKLG